MSLWEFAAAVDGWNAANVGETTVEPMSAEEFDDLVEKYAWVGTA
ncbi:hypothetical protein ACFQU1_20475 [Chelatococcus sp. GCM10030263]